MARKKTCPKQRFVDAENESIFSRSRSIEISPKNDNLPGISDYGTINGNEILPKNYNVIRLSECDVLNGNNVSVNPNQYKPNDVINIKADIPTQSDNLKNFNEDYVGSQSINGRQLPDFMDPHIKSEDYIKSAIENHITVDNIKPETFDATHLEHLESNSYLFRTESGTTYVGPYGTVFIPYEYDDMEDIDEEVDLKGDENVSDTEFKEFKMKDGTKYVGRYGTAFIPNEHEDTDMVEIKEEVDVKEDYECGAESLNSEVENMEMAHVKEEEREIEKALDNYFRKKTIALRFLKSAMPSGSESLIYTCNICQKSFAQKGSLKIHLRRKHFKFSNAQKIYSCKDCLKSFPLEQQLKRHSLVHTGERLYTCKFCAKSFSLAGNLNMHMRIHTGQKPYLCNQCPSSFTQKIGLQRHLKMHIKLCSKGNPFPCNLCEGSFTQKSSLKRHLMKVHSIDLCLNNALSSVPTRDNDDVNDPLSTASKGYTNDTLLNASKRYNNDDVNYPLSTAPEGYIDEVNDITSTNSKRCNNDANDPLSNAPERYNDDEKDGDLPKDGTMV